MLRSLKNIYGFKIHATDGDIGKVNDFFIDQDTWEVRYLVADTGHWLTGRLVLISPASFSGKPRWENNIFPVNLTKKMVKESPDVDVDKPVSRRKEIDVLKYYQWPIYWEPYIGEAAVPKISPVALLEDIYEEGETSHLHSSRKLKGYHIHASDGEIGHVDDFIVDDEKWVIRYFVVDTRNWFAGKKVLVSPLWISKISWELSLVYVELNRDSIKNSPEYNASEPISRKYENRLFDYYAKEKYWEK